MRTGQQSQQSTSFTSITSFTSFTLFTPFKTGALQLSHRVVHAPVTRLRALPDDSPSPMMAVYYAQRATEGGLLITESAHPSADSRGYLGAPGIYTDQHVAAWKTVVDGVHAKGGKIVMQIAHDGRQSHVDLSEGKAPVAPSEVPFDTVVFTADGWVAVSMHRALRRDEIAPLVASFRAAAVRALAAGFDGIEMHAANGYLIDTFLQDGTNKRSDDYGGSIANRARFPLEVLDALIAVWGADRVGVRVSPSGQWGAISDSDPQATFSHFAGELERRKIAYLHIIEPRVMGTETIAAEQAPVASAFLRGFFSGPIISAGGFDRDGAEAIINSGDANLVAFGRAFTSNPDLPQRMARGLPLQPYERAAFWGGDERGYNDFPALQD